APGKVLDIQFGGDNDGANVQTYDYLGNPQQHFNLTLLDAGPQVANGYYQVVARHSDKALNLEGCNLAAGANVVQSTRNTNSACQKWYVQKQGDNFYTLTNNASNRALDIPNCATAPGTNVATWDVYNNDCQKFNLVHVRDGWYTMIARS